MREKEGGRWKGRDVREGGKREREREREREKEREREREREKETGENCENKDVIDEEKWHNTEEGGRQEQITSNSRNTPQYLLHVYISH